MMHQVNQSRLSHGVRAAAMMRRCLNEALRVARHRIAFDRLLITLPLMRRQLLKIMVPTEQALSVFLYTADQMSAADGGDPDAALRLRILTPLLKFRSCRDNIRVATGAMEVRGGNGYIEDWVEARLVRDAHLGVLWESTSNINALDVVARAVRKGKAHEALAAALHRLLEQAEGVPESFRARLAGQAERAVRFAGKVAAEPGEETQSRRAASALYHATSAALMTWEAARIAREAEDARRLILARFVLEHRLSARDPLESDSDRWEEPAIALLLREGRVTMEEALAVVS